jgi:serine/threonine-protein kinase
MSPEQHRGEELDNRTDIYSFGILAFELLTGQRPFDGSTPFKLFLAHVSQDIPNVRKINEDIPKWLAVMIEICTEKSKNHRYPNMKQIVDLFTAKTRKGGKSFFSLFSSSS